jgi:hypothetical protein
MSRAGNSSSCVVELLMYARASGKTTAESYSVHCPAVKVFKYFNCYSVIFNSGWRSRVLYFRKALVDRFLLNASMILTWMGPFDHFERLQENYLRGFLPCSAVSHFSLLLRCSSLRFTTAFCTNFISRRRIKRIAIKSQ